MSDVQHSSIEEITRFEDLAASRREWIETVLQPWCRRAVLRDLRLAEMDWENIAGRVDPAATLWTWAWSRFPALVHEGLSGIDETAEICVTLKEGTQFTGFPDARQSTQGRLVLGSRTDRGRHEECGPFPIDEIASVERC